MSTKLMSGNPHPATDPNAMIIENKSKERMRMEVVETFTALTEESIKESEKLVDRAMDARSAMDSMCDSWKKSWIDFRNTTDERLKEVRMARMSMDSEIRQLMQSLREVRLFFLDKQYEEEKARLAEFVGVCERLQKLKDSGFLDSVADTLLKLSE